MGYILEEFDAAISKVLNEGYEMEDRTGVGCRYLPGISIKMDISERIPVPTRRKTNWKSMLKEYLWFLTGSDEISELQKMGSKVWDSWINKDWATGQGLPETSIGYGYGQNLINAGGTLHSKWTRNLMGNRTDLLINDGVNQIDYVVDLLKNNPNSRRILFDFWRADKVKETILPPCHLVYQFIPTPNKDGELKDLNCVVYARSTDAFVGAGSTNLQGAAFYTYMLAQQVGMKPKELTFISGHFHIYNNHIDLIKEYLDRDQPNSPILKLNKKDSMYEYTADDFVLEDYSPLNRMKVPIAV